jgi:hypothetical protein
MAKADQIPITPEQARNLRDPRWRLSHLYKITDKAGKEVRFVPNWAQSQLLDDMHNQNLVLKARQLGFSTFITLYALDRCIFEKNYRAGVIAHNLDDAKRIFRDKIKYAYDRLPQEIKEAVPAETDRSGELLFGNNSSISVATSFRSGTLQFLHISEFGKICRKYPDKAKEIVTGALQAVQAGQIVFIESTAEGRGGYFFDYCETARKLKESGKKLTSLDYAFHFFPWHGEPAYSIDPVGVPVNPEFHAYFDDLELRHGIKLKPGQKAWYIKKWEVLGEDIYQEFPSTPEEAFKASVRGAYFTKQFTEARKEGRICSVPWHRDLLVDTWWDLGINDQTAIWFSQTVGREIHLIDYAEATGEGFQYYKDLLDDKGYRYGQHHAPHDITVRELSTGISRLESARKLGIAFDVIPRCAVKLDSIDAARNILHLCWFDEEKCDLGIQRLENYRKQWDERLGTYKREPLHDENSNGSDAFQGLAMGISMQDRGKASSRKVVVPSAQGWT